MDYSAQAKELHKNVPPDWYYQSIRSNPFQRFWHNKRFTYAKKFLRPTENNILDVGCADGVFTKVIADTTGADSVTGVDILRSSIDWANDHWKNDARLSFEYADALNLPFDDNAFDAVTCMEMLEHVMDPNTALQEMFRVLRPKGYAVFIVPTDNLLFRIIWAVWTKFRGKIWDETHVQSYTHGSLGTAAEKVGFTIEEEQTFLLGMLYIVRLRK